MPHALRIPSTALPLWATGISFRCTVTPGGTSAAWVRVAGELDLLTAPRLESALREAQIHGRLVMLDTREVTFIDSAGVHAIERASKDFERGGVRLVVATGPVVDRMLALAGVNEQISTCDLSLSEPDHGDRL